MALCLSAALSVPLGAQALSGSSASLDRQNAQARAHDYSFIRDDAHLRWFTAHEALVELRPGASADYELHAVTYPYARPLVKTFVERLSGQYRSACGEKLVVTSLTRPITLQEKLSNGSDRSVHPTGMAVDLRSIGIGASCRRWIERVLLSLEGQGVIEATKERSPAHYHVVVFPNPYERYVSTLAAPRSAASPSSDVVAIEVEVKRGDSLWTLARDHHTTVDELMAVNDLSGSRIYEGQTLRVPAGR